MKQIRNKNDLLAWVEIHTSRKAIANAMIEGKVELFGFFNPAPRSSQSGWIIQITSKYGKIWNVAVTFGKCGLQYYTYTIVEIPWKNYVGGNTPLFAGDNPAEYKELRNAAM